MRLERQPSSVDLGWSHPFDDTRDPPRRSECIARPRFTDLASNQWAADLLGRLADRVPLPKDAWPDRLALHASRSFNTQPRRVITRGPCSREGRLNVTVNTPPEVYGGAGVHFRLTWPRALPAQPKMSSGAVLRCLLGPPHPDGGPGEPWSRAFGTPTAVPSAPPHRRRPLQNALYPCRMAPGPPRRMPPWCTPPWYANPWAATPQAPRTHPIIYGPPPTS